MKPMNILELVLGKLADKEQAMATFNAVGLPDLDAVPPEVDTGEPEELPVEAVPPTGGPPEDSGPPGDLPPMDAGRPEGVPPGEDFFDHETGLPTVLVAEGFPGDREDDEVDDQIEDVDL